MIAVLEKITQNSIHQVKLNMDCFGIMMHCCTYNIRYNIVIKKLFEYGYIESIKNKKMIYILK